MMITIIIITSQGLKLFRMLNSLSSCSTSAVGKSKCGSKLFLLNTVEKNDQKNNIAATVIIIPPTSASIVEGTHSGRNKLFSGLVYVMPRFVLLGSPIKPPHIKPPEKINMPINQR